jgi:hypothetical protein
MEEEENRIIVAPIISDEKQGHFASNIIQTLLGISKEISDSPLAIVWAILLPLLTFLLPLIIKNDPVWVEHRHYFYHEQSPQDQGLQGVIGEQHF